MEYLKRFITIILLPFKAILKLLAFIGVILLITIHCSLFLIMGPILLLPHCIEYITAAPIYYIITGKNYSLKYNTIGEMGWDILFLEKPFRLKSKKEEWQKSNYQPHSREDAEKYAYENDEEDIDVYTMLWRQIKNINLNINYEK